ncbi:MAG: hypothetical protein BGO95_00925 [Micrococcales bacterium 73-13]|nr:MAG: hypothetical protein BGO95_00925 [Micrococcales bacterium 73-13]
MFHSEADFQLALAWQVREANPAMNVRLETRPAPSVHLDMAFETDGYFTAIELKYPTRKWDGVVEGEQYLLKHHGAPDPGRYFIVKDIVRVERFVALRAGGHANGAVVVLTNDPAYWTSMPETNANDRAFRVGDGDTLEPGVHDFTRSTASTRGLDALTLTGRYNLHWTDYRSALDAGGPGLRQLVIEVPGVGSA